MRHVWRLIAVGVALPLAVLGWVLTSSSASAVQKHGQARVLSATLAPSAPSDPSIFGVTPGVVAWQLSHGHVRLGEGGVLEVNVAGLVLAASDSNPLPDISASLYCNGTVAVTTPPVGFSSDGNARIHETVSLPAFCPAPAVLLQPATGTSLNDVISHYIAFDGTT